MEDVREREKIFLDNLKANKPDLFVKSVSSPAEVFERIGITVMSTELPKGYLKFMPADFIVEELGESGKDIGTIEPEKKKLGKATGEGHTYYAELVKINTSTYDALTAISDSLNVPMSKIAYLGMKDTPAITSQRISIGSEDEPDFKKIRSNKFFLKNITRGKGSVLEHDTVGNRYSVFIRSGQAVIAGRMQKRMNELTSKGMINFYGPARFGAPRFLSAELGKYVLSYQFNRALKVFLIASSPYELEAISLLRRKARAVYGNWDEMRRLYSNLPHMLGNEIKALNYLIENPEHQLGGLRVISDQVKYWIYAYNSYLYNQILSALVKAGKDIPGSLPSLLNPDVNDRKIFAPMLVRDGIDDYQKALAIFGVQEKEIFVETQVAIEFAAEPKILEHGVALSFILPKGAYPNVLLSNLFTLYTGRPVPAWVKPAAVDIKAELGLGTAKELNKIFGEEMSKPSGEISEE